MGRIISFTTPLLLSLLATSAFAAECEPVDAAELARYLDEKKTEEIVFFASWCGGCVSHLKDADETKSVLVVAFDEKNAAEKALGSVFSKGSPKCFFDRDGSIVKAYEVTGLPFTKRLTRSSSGS